MGNCLTATYVVIPSVNVTQRIVDEAVENSLDTLRHSLKNPNKVVLKFADKVPEELDMFPHYTYEEWLPIRATKEWTNGAD